MGRKKIKLKYRPDDEDVRFLWFDFGKTPEEIHSGDAQ